MKYFKQPDPPMDAEVGDVWEETDEGKLVVTGRRTVVRVGNDWVAADDAGWTDEVYPTEEAAWEAIGGRE